MLHEEIADHDAFVRAVPVRPLWLLWSGQHHVSIVTGVNFAGIESLAPSVPAEHASITSAVRSSDLSPHGAYTAPWRPES